ncbi:MAG: ABC transporter substrate-binding protein [Ferrovibrionaceae bacterium]
MMRRRSLALLFGAALVMASPLARAQDLPAYYPASYKETIAAAEKEGKLIIYSATDAQAASPLLKDFGKLYPKISVEYNDLNSTELYNRLISEIAAGAGSGDLAWSSAIDLQIKLIQDGYGQAYTSPEKEKIPSWANYKDLAYGSTFEPIVFVYNKRLLPADQVPKNHKAFATYLNANAAALKGKVTTYDPERSGTGFVYVTQDDRNDPAFWDLVKALGRVDVKLYTSTGTMLERIGSGEHTLGFNMIGSYAVNRMRKDPSIAIQYPEDYITVVSRAMFIPKGARNPNAAKLFIDYILSHRGQKIIADQSGLYSMRQDVDGSYTAQALTKTYGEKLKPIPLNDDVTAYLDQQKRLGFLKSWRDNLQAGK